MKVTAAALAEERKTAQSLDQSIRAEARIAWAKRHDGEECPSNQIPSSDELAERLPKSPEATRAAVIDLADEVWAVLLKASIIHPDFLSEINDTQPTWTLGALAQHHMPFTKPTLGVYYDMWRRARPHDPEAAAPVRPP